MKTVVCLSPAATNGITLYFDNFTAFQHHAAHVTYYPCKHDSCNLFLSRLSSLTSHLDLPSLPSLTLIFPYPHFHYHAWVYCNKIPSSGVPEA